MENTLHSENQLPINPDIKSYLLETAKWGKFLAIVGFVGIGIMLLIGLFSLFGISFMSMLSKSYSPLSFFSVLYIIMAIIYFIPTNYLYTFSREMTNGLLSNDEHLVTNGFYNLKRLFKFIAIVSIVILSLYALILIFAIPSLLFFKSATHSIMNMN